MPYRCELLVLEFFFGGFEGGLLLAFVAITLMFDDEFVLKKFGKKREEIYFV